jgi:hypothetical protein
MKKKDKMITRISLFLVASLLVPLADGMGHNYQKEAKIKKVTTQTIVKKIRTGCLGENTTTLLETIHKKDPTNHALQAYIVGKTWHIMRQYKHYSYGQTIDEFKRIARKACQTHDKEGQEVAEVMECYFRSCNQDKSSGGKLLCYWEGNNPIEMAVSMKYAAAVSFLISMQEPLLPSQIATACKKEDLTSLQLLLAAGCPTYNNNKGIEEQPLTHALKIKNDQYMKMLIPHVNLNATFKGDSREVTIPDYFSSHQSTYPQEYYHLACYQFAVSLKDRMQRNK